MTPFSHFLRKLRTDRHITQKDMAEFLGYEQSYLSALENGAKGTPKKQFLDQVVKRLNLDAQEKLALFNAANISRRSIKLPFKASCEIFEICHELEQQLPRLTHFQLELITLALRLNHVKANVQVLTPAFKDLNQTESEAPRM
jgi:transcriptional regulator with XRE-family HTH domain